MFLKFFYWLRDIYYPHKPWRFSECPEDKPDCREINWLAVVLTFVCYPVPLYAWLIVRLCG